MKCGLDEPSVESGSANQTNNQQLSRIQPTREVKKRIDYLTFHTTGEKVLKRTSPTMSLTGESITIEHELKVSRKLERFVEENDLELFFDTEEVSHAIDVCRMILQEYEEVHVELIHELGTENYEQRFKIDYEKLRETMMSWIKSAKIDVNRRKKHVAEQVFDRLRSEENLLYKKIVIELRNFSVESPVLLETHERQMNVAEQLISEYTIMYQKIGEHGHTFTEEFGSRYDEMCIRLNEVVTSRRESIQNLKLSLRAAEESRIAEEASERYSKEKDELILSCKSVFSNISDRFSDLETKLQVQASGLSDAKLLEEQKELKTTVKEYHDILDKILKLSQSNPGRYAETEDLLPSVDERKEKLKNLLDQVRAEIVNEIEIRGISEEKVKNASLLGIKLPKFGDYKSDLDFYTFKGKFLQYFASKVKPALLPDYLKNNYLTGQALQIAKEIEDLDAIWERLEECFGHVPTLLNIKLEELQKCTPLDKLRGERAINENLVKIRNVMKELSTLAEEHGVEHSLYHSSNLAKIYILLGKKRHVELTKTLLDANKEGERGIWDHVLASVDKEIRINEQIMLYHPALPNRSDSTHFAGGASQLVCEICGQTGHVPTMTKSGKMIINYHSCEKFVNMNPKERFDELKKKGLCCQCLTPGRKFGHPGKCFDGYACPHVSHKGYNRSLHILVCDRHKHNPENLKLLDTYKNRCIENRNHENFTLNIKIAFHVVSAHPGAYEVGLEVELDDCEKDVSIYMLQTIRISEDNFNLFFDNGCSDMVVSKRALDILIRLGRAVLISRKQSSMAGIGDLKTVSHYGRWRITIPLSNGRQMALTGQCLEKITGRFIDFPLDKVGEDFQTSCQNAGQNPESLPRLPKSVGGDTDIMIGIQYLKYWPRYVHQLENGCTLYRSQFESSDGTRGVVGGPHESFNELYDNYNAHHVYFNDEVRDFIRGFKMAMQTDTHDISSNEVEFTGSSSRMDSSLFSGEREMVTEFIGPAPPDPCQQIYHVKKTPKQLKTFEMIENAGTEISYRCVNCRGCAVCKKSSQVELISLQEELEQAMIEKSVTVNLEEGFSIAYLPFLCDPIKKLANNFNIALKSYKAQVRRLESKPEDKKDVLKSMDKLRSLGYVDKLKNLSDDQQSLIKSSPVSYFIPWLVAFSKNSVSTPCRPVFNASSVTASGYSLNDLLPKGRNNLNKLVQIFILWLTFWCAYCTDIQKMYNTIRLVPEHWCYQLILWDDELRADRDPEINVLKTLFYGVRPSGNQAESALRKTTSLQKDEYPTQDEIIQNRTYVDDCASGSTVFNDKGGLCHESSYNEARKDTDDLQTVLSKGNFHLKGITFSGYDPPDHLSNEDKKSVTVFGIKWFPKEDVLNLNIRDQNLSVTKRNKASKSELTRRSCASRVGEIFDLNGRFAPLIAEFKLDLHELCTRKLDWDDNIPDDLISKWLKNLDKISQMREIKFRRCVIPEDAVNLDIETIEISDASSKMACSAIYVRFKRRNGLYSCQLIFARSKIVPDNMTLPRAELFAATLNATTGHIVALSLLDLIKDRVCLIDSQVALFWILSTHSQLKQWVRNRVVEILRLTVKDYWYYIDSKNNMADIATRRGAKLLDVGDGSVWITGHDWAKLSKDQFPIKSAYDIKMSQDINQDFSVELLGNDITDPEWIQNQLSGSYYSGIEDTASVKIAKMYTFSKYVMDPNRFRFRKVLRIVALVLKFIRNVKQRIAAKKGSNVPVIDEEMHLPALLNFCNDKYLITDGQDPRLKCPSGLVIELTERDLLDSLYYYFTKATREIRHFNRKESYVRETTEKNQILYYTGRILPSQQFDNNSGLQLSDVCLDLCASTFFVPVIDKHSPLAYALINEVHWHDPDAQHSGNETVMRHLLKICYIFEGSRLIDLFRKNCPRCRYLHEKKIEVVMGPKCNENLTIAPAFYFTQVDLFGPFKSYSNSNKRAEVNIWFAIFCCTVTGAVDLKTLEDYSTGSFVSAFVRFGCTFGWPKKLMPDPGSQLLKACTSMRLTSRDIQQQISEYGVEFKPCPVNSHYMHGKVERKIRHVKETMAKHLHKPKLSQIQWETIGFQVANSINNLPISAGKNTKGVEHLDLITPNRLLLGRNNNRSPAGTLTLNDDFCKIISQNESIFKTWFQAWLVSCVPGLMYHPKWFNSDVDPNVGDVVLFLKSEKEFQSIYQYGIISDRKISRDGKIREIEVEYQNHFEKVKRRVPRGTREVVVIHPSQELGLMRELNALATSLE